MKRLDVAALTVLDAETGSPLFERHLFVFVGVALLEEAGGAVLHGHQRDAQRGQLGVGQEPARKTGVTTLDLCGQFG